MKIYANVNLEQLNCAECNVLFWISEQSNERYRKSHKTFYCPNGHTQWYYGIKPEDRINDLI